MVDTRQLSNWKHFSLFFLLFFTTQMDFRGSEFVVSGNIDIQVMIRLATLAFIFAVSLPHINIFLRHIRQLPVFLHVFFLLYLLIISSQFEMVNFYTYYALATHFIIFYIVVIMVNRYGVDNMIYYYVSGVVIFATISLFYYYNIPDIGRYAYWQDNVFTQSTRLKGIGGHPNTMGFMLATAILGFVHLAVKKHPINKLLYFGAMLILLCLILTNSRTSMAGMMLMIVIYMAIYLRILPIFIAAIAVFGGLVFLSLELSWGIIPEILQMASRSGDAREITSLTGRSHIWEQMFVLIQVNPIFGWGHAVLENVLVAHADEIGFSIGQAHNLYLQILFSGGVVGLSLFLAGIIVALSISTIKAIYTRHAFELCIIIYILLGGITEASMLASIAVNSYLLLSLSLASLSVYCEKSRLEKVIE